MVSARKSPVAFNVPSSKAHMAVRRARMSREGSADGADFMAGAGIGLSSGWFRGIKSSSNMLMPVLDGGTSTTARQCKVFGDGLEAATTRSIAMFTIQSCDAMGAPIGTGGDPFSLSKTGFQLHPWLPLKAAHACYNAIQMREITI